MRGISPPDCAICAQPMASWEATYHAEWVHQDCSDEQWRENYLSRAKMPDDEVDRLFDSRIKDFEGERRKENGNHELYTCPAGHLTIGWGYNIEANGITDRIAELLLKYSRDIAKFELDSHIPWWRKMPLRAQAVMLDMCFNMGWGNGKRGLSSLRTFLDAMHAGDYDLAADYVWNPTKSASEQRYKYSRDVGERRAGANARLLREAV